MSSQIRTHRHIHTHMYTLIHMDTRTQLWYEFSTKKDCTTHISLEPVFFHFMIPCEFLSRSICKDLLYSYFKIKLAVSLPHRALCSSVFCGVYSDKTWQLPCAYLLPRVSQPFHDHTLGAASPSHCLVVRSLCPMVGGWGLAHPLCL